MDLRKLKTLIDLVSESNVSELEITEADGKVRIVKAGAQPVVVQTVAAAPAVAPVPRDGELLCKDGSLWPASAADATCESRGGVAARAPMPRQAAPPPAPRP